MIPRIFLFLWLYCASIGGVFAFLNAAERMSGGLLSLAWPLQFTGHGSKHDDQKRNDKEL